MNWASLLELLSQQWQQTSNLELIAVCFSVTSVLMAFRNSVLLYPAGLVSTGIYTWLMSRPNPGLYADASLNLYYFIVSIYGWAQWTRRSKKKEELPITFASKRDWKIVALIAASAFAVLFLVLKNFTPSTVPVMDAFVSGTAWAGMWLLARRKVENWTVLNISNIVAIPLLFHKNMPLTALLTTFLFIVAIFGYYKWKKLAQTEQKEEETIKKEASFNVEA